MNSEKLNKGLKIMEIRAMLQKLGWPIISLTQGEDDESEIKMAAESIEKHNRREIHRNYLQRVREIYAAQGKKGRIHGKTK